MALNSCAMSGQSVVHTGSRKVSSTTLPRRLARVTVRPSWSVSRNGDAGLSSGGEYPAMACARMGSAVGLSDAAAIGAAPITITPRAARAVTVCIEVAASAARPLRAAAAPAIARQARE